MLPAVAEAGSSQGGAHTLKHGRILLSRSPSPQPDCGEEEALLPAAACAASAECAASGTELVPAESESAAKSAAESASEPIVPPTLVPNSASATCCVVTPDGPCGANAHLGWYKLGRERAGADHCALWLSDPPMFQRDGGQWEHDVGLTAEEVATWVQLGAEAAAKSRTGTAEKSTTTARPAAAVPAAADSAFGVTIQGEAGLLELG